MLQIKSFNIGDGEIISEFLKHNVPHKSANILISEGQLAIPYEDGLAPNKEQLILMAMEDKNMMADTLSPITHSQRVLELQIIGVEKQIGEQKAIIEKLEIITSESNPKGKKEVYNDIKNAEKEIKRLENVKTQTENQMIMNQAEITRITMNLAVYDETIAKLKEE